MRSLKNRLIGAATIWIAIGMIAAGFVLSAIFKKHVTEQFWDELYVHLDELQRLTETDDKGAHLQRNLSDPRYEVALSGFYWEIQQSGAILARSPSLQGQALKMPSDGTDGTDVHTHTIEGPTGALLVAEKTFAKPQEASPVQYIIGTDERHLDEVLKSFNQTLSWSLAGFGVSMVVAATLLILFAMRPFEQLRTSLASVRSGDSKGLPSHFPTEVQPLVDDLNTLLSSTAELIQRARTQAGNLAHGLKTPLAILTDEAYRIEGRGLSDASKTILGECQKMQTQIDYQLARARAVALRSTPGTVASVNKAASEVTSALQRLHIDRGVTIENAVENDLQVACDAQDLNEMLANLVDNACKHAARSVRISTKRSKEPAVLIFIEDDGIGLPPEAREVVFKVGERWDTQLPGSGLGLAIVRELARLYGGDATLATSELGGLLATLELPSVMTTARPAD
ncbi:MAG: ATP-binding protein [Hyphomicrobium sp.]